MTVIRARKSCFYGYKSIFHFLGVEQLLFSAQNSIQKKSFGHKMGTHFGHPYEVFYSSMSVPIKKEQISQILERLV